MVVSALILAAILAACAADPLQAAKAEVDGRLAYRPYAARDYRPFAASGQGNCAVFAASYAAEARRRGIAGHVETCVLANGSGHAYFVAESGQILDVRQQAVGTAGAKGCLAGSRRVVQTLALR